MKLMTLPQYMKMSKPALIRKIMKTLRAMPKAKLARLCYNITKSKLPQLRKIRSKQIGARHGFPDYIVKRKFTKRQLAAQKLFAKRSRAGTLRKRRR